MGTSIGRGRRSITCGFLADEYDGYDSGNDSRNFQRTFDEHQTFQMISVMMLALENGSKNTLKTLETRAGFRVAKAWASTQDIDCSL